MRKDELFVVYGDDAVIRAAADRFEPGLSLAVIDRPDQAQSGRLNILSPGILSEKELRPGNLRKEAGAASLEYVRRAAEDTARGLTSGIVTLPVNKEAVRLSSPDFTGHTGFIAKLVGGKAVDAAGGRRPLRLSRQHPLLIKNGHRTGAEGTNRSRHPAYLGDPDGAGKGGRRPGSCRSQPSRRRGRRLRR